MNRRYFFGSMALGTAAFTVRGAFAEELTRTPRQTEGPFYPNKLPLDTDNDLLIINDSITPAVGEITHLSGRCSTPRAIPCGMPSWKSGSATTTDVYLHTAPATRQAGQELPGLRPVHHRIDWRVLLPNNQAGSLPRPYPHIHFKIKQAGKELLTTQCYVKGHAGNAKDAIYRSLRDAKARDSITVDFVKLKDSKIGELEAKFDLVLGVTPEE